MRIGVFTDSYKPYTSGVVTSISTFKEELTKLGHEIFIFAPNYPHYTETEEDVYRFYSLPSPTNPDYTLAIPLYPGMNMLLKRLDLDVIHVHSPFTMGRVGLHYSKKHNLPLIFTYHTLYDQYVHYVPVAQELAKEVTIKYSKNFCNQCDHIVVPSTEVQDILSGYQIKTPVSVIPTGVPIHRFKEREHNWLQNNFNIPANNKVLLFVGRLTKEKNLEFLIRAFKQVHDQVPNTTLVLTAQGPLEGDLKKLTAKLGLNLEDEVVFTGALPFETLIDVYFSSDLFVFSSVTETQGLVLIEAMAAGLPVVAVRAFGVLDMVDSGINGILTECDQEEFAQAVIRVLNDPETYDYFKSNALVKAESLSSAAMARKLDEVYKSVSSKTNITRRPRILENISSWFSY